MRGTARLFCLLAVLAGLTACHSGSSSVKEYSAAEFYKNADFDGASWTGCTQSHP